MQFLHCLLCVCSKVVWSKARRKGKMKDRVKSAELWGLRSSALCSHVNLFQAHPATFSTPVLHPSQMFWNPSKAWTNCCLKIKLWCFRCVCDSNCVGDIVMLGVPREPYFPEICPLFHITQFSLQNLTQLIFQFFNQVYKDSSKQRHKNFIVCTWSISLNWTFLIKLIWLFLQYWWEPK